MCNIQTLYYLYKYLFNVSWAISGFLVKNAACKVCICNTLSHMEDMHILILPAIIIITFFNILCERHYHIEIIAYYGNLKKIC